MFTKLPLTGFAVLPTCATDLLRQKLHGAAAETIIPRKEETPLWDEDAKNLGVDSQK